MRRVVLFDIDGTLVRAGPAKGAFEQAMLETFGTTGDVKGTSFAGKTDPQIARELLVGAGFSTEEIDRELERLWPRYLRLLEERLPESPMEVLPGVPALLDALGEVGDVALGLLTGNIEQGARLKLGSARLWGSFRFGSYGSDHEDRDRLPAIALRRAEEVWGRSFDPGDAVVVGDTPRDVACGRYGGARTLAVATGRYGSDELAACGADRVVPDLSATDDVLAWLAA